MDPVQFRPVLTKRDFVQRYKAGEFGNASPTWNSFEDFMEHSKIYQTYWEATQSPKYHLRGRVAGSETHYNLSAWEVAYKWFRKSDRELWYCSAMAPLHLLNGELMRRHDGLYMFYSTVRKPMRDSLKEGGREAHGLTVKLILEQFMNVASYEWAMALLDRYPDHVVEFTVVDRCWGTVPGFNTLFWEVRKY